MAMVINTKLNRNAYLCVNQLGGVNPCHAKSNGTILNDKIKTTIRPPASSLLLISIVLCIKNNTARTMIKIPTKMLGGPSLKSSQLNIFVYKFPNISKNEPFRANDKFFVPPDFPPLKAIKVGSNTTTDKPPAIKEDTIYVLALFQKYFNFDSVGKRTQNII